MGDKRESLFFYSTDCVDLLLSDEFVWGGKGEGGGGAGLGVASVSYPREADAVIFVSMRVFTNSK